MAKFSLDVKSLLGLNRSKTCTRKSNVDHDTERKARGNVEVAKVEVTVIEDHIKYSMPK